VGEDDDLGDDDTAIPPGDLAVADADAAVLGAASDDRVGERFDAGDLNGDGVDDLVVQAGPTSGSHELHIFHGPLSSVTTTAAADATITTGPAWSKLWLSGIADVDRDGTDDVLVGVWNYSGPPVYGFAFLGPFAGSLTPADADVIFSLDEPGCSLMSVQAMPAGDLDGDGAGDLAVAVWGFCGDSSSEVTSSVFLFHGPLVPGNVDLASADARLRWDGSVEIGLEPRRVGDVDGDGTDDLMVQRDGYYDGEREAHLFTAPLAGVVSLADAAATFDDLVDAGGGARPGDVGGDPRQDLMLADGGSAADAQGRVWVFFDTGPGVHSYEDADAQVTGASPDDHLGSGASIGGDLDGDGRCDLVAGATGTDVIAHQAGTTYLFTSVPAGVFTTEDAALQIHGVQEWEESGTQLLAGADLDGDGLDDLLIGALGYDDSTIDDVGAIYLFSGAQIRAALSP